MQLAGGGSKPPVASTTSGSNDGPLGPTGSSLAPGGDGDGAEAPETRQRQPVVTFRLDPEEIESGTPVLLIDDTDVSPDDSILVSEWRIEGPGLTIPAKLLGEEAEFQFPQGGLFRISHRLQLKEGGLTDWMTQAVVVAQGQETAEELQPGGRPLRVLETVTDAEGAIDIWIEDEQVRFRVNSEALGETKNGLMQNFEARVTYDSGMTSGIGPGSYRMDTALVAGPELGAVSSLRVTGTLPSGRQWDQTFHIR